MSTLHDSPRAERAYPSRVIDFAVFEYFVRSIPEIETHCIADDWDGSRTLALRNMATGRDELIAVPLDSGNVGFLVLPSPSRSLQRLICRRFGIDFIFDDEAHHVGFLIAETQNLMPHAVAG